MPEVRVKQKDGDITIRSGPDEPVTWHIKDHTTNVADDKLELFLANIEGAKEVSEPETKQKEK